MSNEENNNETELDFSKIGVSEDQLKKSRERPRLPDNRWARLEIQNPKAEIRGGRAQISFLAVPMENPEDSSTVNARYGFYDRIELPTQTMEPGVLSKVLGRCATFLAAVGVDTKRPTYSKATKKFSYNGEELTKAVAEELLAESDRLTNQEIIRVAKDPKQLDNLAYYGLIKHNGTYTNVVARAKSMPEDGIYFTAGGGEEAPF